MLGPLSFFNYNHTLKDFQLYLLLFIKENMICVQVRCLSKREALCGRTCRTSLRTVLKLFTFIYKFSFQNNYLKLLEFENEPDVIHDFKIISNKTTIVFLPKRKTKLLLSCIPCTRCYVDDQEACKRDKNCKIFHNLKVCTGRARPIKENVRPTREKLKISG